MTHTDLGVGEATWTASLRVIGHSWRAGQWNYQLPHGIPIPAVTDDLLMRMLREFLRRRLHVQIWVRGDEQVEIVVGNGKIREWGETEAAAIIRATATLEVK